MRKLLIISLAFLMFACKQSTNDLSGDAPLKINDFYKVFNTVSLPINISDTNFEKLNEGTEIGRKLLGQYLNTAALDTIVPVNAKKTTIIPLFQINKDGEHYLLLKLKQAQKNNIGILVFNKENKFMDYKNIIEFTKGNHDESYKSKSLNINNEPSFLLEEQKINNAKETYNEKSAWAYSEGKFRIIFFDSEQKLKNKKIINPIDTLPTNNEFSGNYELNSKNFIAIRDNGAANKYQFFLHTEKNEGTCNGELKGVLTFKKNMATYAENGDACHIQFIINGTNINIKEDGNCGNHRGIKCSFDESFERRKKLKKKK